MTDFPEYKKTLNNIKGIFYDFDGTLVDSRQKNFNVTKSVVEVVTGKSAESFQILKSLQHYLQSLRESTNWRDFYLNNFKISDDVTDYAGSLWTEYQLRDKTPAPVITGIPKLLKEFKNITQGIISQNSRDLILKILVEDNLQDYFNFIVGYEEVGIRNQKPDPEGLIKSMEKISRPISGTFIYIGDHESDVEFTRNTNLHLKENAIEAEVISIAVHFNRESDQHLWHHQPDYQVNSVSELGEILRRFVLFE